MGKKKIDSTPILIMLLCMMTLIDGYCIVQMRDAYYILVLALMATGILSFVTAYDIYGKMYKLIEEKRKNHETYMKSQKAIYGALKHSMDKMEELSAGLASTNNTTVTEELNHIADTIQEVKEEMITNDKAIAKTVIKKMNDYVGDIKFSISNIDMKKEEHNETYNMAFDIEKARQDVVNSIVNVSDECTGIKEILQEILSSKEVVKAQEIQEVQEVQEVQTEIEMHEDKIEEVQEKQEVQEEQPEIDLSDPNKQLSPDEIAALFASMGA